MPLDATGQDQAARLARRLATTALAGVWSSPLARAVQTATPLGAPRLDEGLLEVDMGALEGLDGAEFQARWPEVAAAWRDQPHAVALPGGERLVDVQARGLAAIDRVAGALGPGEVGVVVTHQILLATVVCALSGASIGEYRRFMHRNTGITTVELGEARRLVGFDDAAHLELPAS